MAQFEQFVVNHWVLWLALLAVVGLTIINEWWEQKNRLKQLTPQQAINLINNHQAVVIDLRDKESYRLGHVTEAVSLNQADISEKKLAIYKGRPIILVVNESQSVNLSLPNFELKSLSISAWKNAGFPLIKDK